jgi:hypothetical protein
MVKLTSDESFLCMSVIVALATGCLIEVSNATPLTTPFFCASAIKHDERKIAHKQNCLMTLIELRKYSQGKIKPVNHSCFNVNEG